MAEANQNTEITTFEDYPQLNSLAPEAPILELEDYLKIFKTFSDPTRLTIVLYLYEQGEAHEQELAKHVEKSGNSLHYHVRKLIQAGVVANTRRETRESDGVHSYYELTDIGESAASHVFAVFREQRDIVEGALDEQEDDQTASIGRELSGLLTASNNALQNWAVSSLAELAELNPDAIIDSIPELEHLLGDDDIAIQNQAAKGLLAIGERAPELLPDNLQDRMQNVVEAFQPDVIDSFEEFIQFYDNARKLLELSGEYEQAGNFSMAIGQLYWKATEKEHTAKISNNTDLDSAEDAFLTAADLFERADSVNLSSQALQELGQFLTEVGRADEALDHLAQAEHFAEEADDTEFLVGAKLSQALAERAVGQDETAVTLLREAHELAAANELRQTEVITLIQKAIFQRKSMAQGEVPEDKLDEIRDSLETAAEIAATEDLDPEFSRKAAFELGLTNARLGQREEALDDFRRSREIAEEMEQPRLVALASENLGVAYDEGGQTERARDAYEYALEQYRSAEAEAEVPDRNVVDVLQKLATLMDTNDQTAAAIEYCEQGLDQIESISAELEGETDTVPEWLQTRTCWFKRMIAVLRDDLAVLEDVFTTALGVMQNSNYERALDILRDIWQLREDTDPDSEIFPLIISSGAVMMGCLAYLDRPGEAEIQEAVNEYHDLLDVPTQTLFDWLTTDELAVDKTLERLEAISAEGSEPLLSKEALILRNLVLDIDDESTYPEQRPDEQSLLDMDEQSKTGVLG